MFCFLAPHFPITSVAVADLVLPASSLPIKKLSWVVNILHIHTPIHEIDINLVELCRRQMTTGLKTAAHMDQA